MKNQYRGRDCLKEGGFGQFANLRGGLARKRGGLIPQCTLCYGWVYKTLRLSPLVVEHSVLVMSTRLNLMGSQFSIPVL